MRYQATFPSTACLRLVLSIVLPLGAWSVFLTLDGSDAPHFSNTHSPIRSFSVDNRSVLGGFRAIITPAGGLHPFLVCTPSLVQVRCEKSGRWSAPLP